MKNKLIASALVLGFSFAPISAFADSLTTTQGGTPVYSCPQGSEKVGTNCVTPDIIEPATSTTTDFHYEYSTWTFSTPVSVYYTPFINAGCPREQRVTIYETEGREDYKWKCPGGETTYTCSNGSTPDNNNMCLISASSTSPAVISGSNGGSLVASVTGFLTPVWNFLTTKLLPAIMALVILGIGVRLSIKAVRKYSKVA